jgi:Protein of unknown function (DUF3631)
MTNLERDACALWILHTYVIRHFMISPKLFVHSPMKECGKSTLFDILNHLVARPLLAENITTATCFRIIAKHQPTLLIDEVDSFLKENDELRGVLNASHRYDGRVPRLIGAGDDYEPRNFKVYAAVALAGIGWLHPTLMSRSIVIDLQRAGRNDQLEPLRIGKTDHLDELARRIVRWVTASEERIAAMEPAMPGDLVNRAADNWLPLLAIADAAGGEWKERARAAATGLSAGAPSDSLEMLLSDIRDVFYGRAEPQEPPKLSRAISKRPLKEMKSAELVEALTAIPGHPWGEVGKSKKPLTQHQLASRLRPLRIMTKKLHPPGEASANGYLFADLEAAFERYLPPEGDSRSDSRTHADEMDTSDDSRSDSPESVSPTWKCKKSANDGHESESPSRKGGNGEARTSAAAEPCAARSPEPAPDPTEPCAYCGCPGGNLVAFGDGGLTRLHRHCEEPWIERRMAEQGVWCA